MPKKELSVEAVNERLKHTGVRLEQRGNKLSLRATLPSRRGEGQRQQRISLGVEAIPLGLEYAEAKAWELAAQKAQNRFQWEDWDGNVGKRECLTCADWIERYRQECKARGLLKDPDAWRRYFWEVFKHLPQGKPLTEGAVLAVALRSEENSRTRKHNCTQLKKLANLAGLEIDLSEYEGNYSPSRTKPRSLPSDLAIAQIRNSFFNSQKKLEAASWQWAYGVMAAYGLRDHEIFFCKIHANPPYLCEVFEGKTGPREVYPFYLEWVEQWRLWEVRAPKTVALEQFERNEQGYQRLGQKVSGALGRYIRRNPEELRHQPYDLRHAYVLRAAVRFGMPHKVVAMYCGHSLDTHIRIYTKYLNKLDAATEYQERMQGDRPKPPSSL